MAELKVGLPHRDTQGFGFVAAGDGAAIVVGQHHNRLSHQAWPKHALA
jgi:hypothetical protein